MSRLPIIPAAYSAETIADAKNYIAREARNGLSSVQNIKDGPTDLVLFFANAVGIPLYRLPIVWKSLEMYADSDAIIFNYVPGYGLATSDSNELTRLVIAAHERGCQVRIQPKGAQHLKISISRWRRWAGIAGEWNGTHPTMSQAIRAFHTGEYVPQENHPSDFLDCELPENPANSREYSAGFRADHGPNPWPAGSNRALLFNAGAVAYQCRPVQDGER